MTVQPPRSPGGELECSICLELLTENPEEKDEHDHEEEEPVAGPSRPAKRARLLPEVDSTKCGHVYHKCCISKCLKMKKKACPLCREKLSRNGLRKIILPLSEDAQCRKCKWRVVELDGLKFQLEGEKQRVEELGRNLEGKAKQVVELKEKVEEIQMAMDTDVVKYKRQMGNMALDFEEAKRKMREEFGREMEDIEESGEREVKRREEDLRKVVKMKAEVEGKLRLVRKENERLKREKEVLMGREGKKGMEREGWRMRDWQEMYKLCRMERDKEREMKGYFEKWCKRLVGISESSPCDITELTLALQRKLSGDGGFSSNADDDDALNLSESDDDQENREHLKGNHLTSGFVENDLFLSSDEEEEDDREDNALSRSSGSDDDEDNAD